MKKILSVFCSLAMMFSIFTVSIHSEDDTEQPFNSTNEVEQMKENNELTDVADGTATEVGETTEVVDEAATEDDSNEESSEEEIESNEEDEDEANGENVENSIDYEFDYHDVNHEISYTTNSAKAYRLANNRASSVPSSYSLQSQKRVSSAVRNQNPYGTCWAFSAIASGESSLITDGLASTSIDLSELQLAYFAYHKVNDPLGLTNGDTTKLVGSAFGTTNSNKSLFLSAGGNNFFTNQILASWIGMTSESSLPYSYASKIASGSYTPSSSISYSSNSYQLDESAIVPMSDVNAVKQLVMEQGALAVSYYHSDSYYNSKTYAYNNPNNNLTNHAVTLVGWDDDFAASNFKSTPSKNGAWLIKNSWGSSWGNKGYFWISYEDASLSESYAFSFQMKNASKLDYNYQYDGNASLNSLRAYNSIQGANIFTAKSNITLEEIGFFTESNNVDYIIDIYTNPRVASDPTSGDLVYTSYGTATYAGYHTPSLDYSVRVSNGEKFSVVVTLSKEGSYVDLDTDSTQSYTWLEVVSSSSANQSFYRTKTTNNWTDTSKLSRSCNVRIKALANEDAYVADITYNSITELNVGENFSLKAQTYPAVANIEYTSSNPEVVSVSSNGTLTGISKGEAVISIKSKDIEKEVSIIVNSHITKVTLDKTSYTLTNNGSTKSVNATASIYPNPTEDDPTLTWDTLDHSIATVDDKGVVTFVDYGTTTLVATSVTGVTTKATINCVIGTISTPSLTVESNSYNSIKLTWNLADDDDVTGYVIYRATSYSGKYSKIATITDSDIKEYTNSQLTTGRTYYYLVKSYKTANDQTKYSSSSKKLGAKPYTEAPNVTATPYSGGIKISWDKVSGASGYVVYRSSSVDGTYKAIKTLSSKYSYYNNASSNCTQTYYYKVRAYRVVSRKKVYGYTSDIESAIANPLKVGTVKISNIDENTLRVYWGKVSYAKGYEVYRSIYGSDDYLLVATVSGTSFDDNTIEFNTKYSYKVRAYQDIDEAAYGNFSSIASGYSRVRTPSVSCSVEAFASINVKIAQNTNVDGYEVYRRNGTRGSYAYVSDVKNTNAVNGYVSYIDTDKNPKTTYYYIVRAYKMAGETKVYSSFSSAKSCVGYKLSKVNGSIKTKVYSATKAGYMNVTKYKYSIINYDQNSNTYSVKVTVYYSKARFEKGNTDFSLVLTDKNLAKSQEVEFSKYYSSARTNYNSSISFNVSNVSYDLINFYFGE